MKILALNSGLIGDHWSCR